MYEDITHATLLEDMQDEVIDDMEDGKDVDVEEGSLAYNNMSAAAYEVEKLYREIDAHNTNLDPEQADFDGMVLLAKQRYLSPRQPTHAYGKIVCDPESIEIGTRFSIDEYTYEVIEQNDDGSYLGMCEQEGSAPNSVLGELDPIDYIQDFQSAELTEITIKGEDLETKESLYRRYIANLTDDGFAGNVSAYKTYLLSQDGIGACKVWPAWKGGSTVLCVILDSEYMPITDELAVDLLAQICPEKYKGKGIAPIGADVTIRPARPVTCNVTAKFEFEDGTTLDSCKDALIKATEAYLETLREAWGDGDEESHLTVYVSRLLTAMLTVSEVVDISDVTINGAEGNVALAWDEVPVMGEINEKV